MTKATDGRERIDAILAKSRQASIVSREMATQSRELTARWPAWLRDGYGGPPSSPPTAQLGPDLLGKIVPPAPEVATPAAERHHEPTDPTT